MSPALQLLLFVTGSSLFIVGVLAGVLGWLAPMPAGALAVAGAVLEATAAIAFVRSRQAARRDGGRR
jgi:hypothetical protein